MPDTHVMDRFWDKFQDNVDMSIRCLNHWISGGREDVDIDLAQKKMASVNQFMWLDAVNCCFRPERYLGIFTYFLHYTPETTWLLLWRLELNEKLASNRTDPRYLEHALADHKKRLELGENDWGECSRIQMLFGNHQEAVRGYEKIEDTKGILATEIAEANLLAGYVERAIAILTDRLDDQLCSEIELLTLRALRGHAFDLAGDAKNRDCDWNSIWQAAKRNRPDQPLAYVLDLHHRAGNHDYVIHSIDSTIRSDSGRSGCELLEIRAKALRGLAERTFNENLSDNEFRCLREIVERDPSFTRSWERLFQKMETEWRYDAAIELAEQRPSKDVVWTSRNGCIVSTNSLYKIYNSTMPYWQGRRSLLEGDYEEAIGYFETLPREDTNLMELAIACGYMDNAERMHQTFDMVFDPRLR